MWPGATNILTGQAHTVEMRRRNEADRVKVLREAITIGESDVARGDLADHNPSLFDDIDADLDRG